MLGIVFTGASGVGKSTLARWAASRFMLPLLPSVTTDVYRERGTTFEEAFRDAERLEEIQHEIHKRTTERLATYVNPAGWPRRVGDMIQPRPNGFVTDRGPDVLVYTALMIHGAYPDGLPEELDKILRRPDVLTVFVRPCRAVLDKARDTDGGRRNKFLSDDWVYRVDGGIAYHLETRNIPHITLDGDDHRGRRCSVLRAVSAIKWNGWPETPPAPTKGQRRKRAARNRGVNWEL